MNEQLERLIKLQKIDSKILAINQVIKEFPSKIAEAELPLRESQSSLSDVKQKINSLEKKKRDKEQALDGMNEKINKLKLRTAEIKTNKEYQALLKEIEAVEKERSSVEDEILVIMEEMDNASKQAKTEEAKYKADKNRIEAFKKKIENEKLEIEKELLTVKEASSAITSGVDRELYDQYISLLDACGGLAVVEARGEICQGCNMNIPPQLFVEIKKNEEIFNCPQCRRILYFKNTM